MIGKAWLKRMRRAWRHERHLKAAAITADAFLVSYPKSGRTWLRYLLSRYFAEAAGLDFRPDLASTFRVLPNFDRDAVRGIGAFVGRRPGLPAILVSHLRHDRRLFADRPVILLVRDPRDVIVSAYFHATRHKHSFSGDIDGFLDDPRYGLPALTGFLNGWAEGLAGRRHLVLSYERMQAEPEAAVGDLLRFLGQAARPDILARAIDAARFDRMREKERDQGIPGHDYDRTDDQSLRMRSGRAKAFLDTLTPTQANAIIARCRTDLTPRAWALLAGTGVEDAAAARIVLPAFA